MDYRNEKCSQCKDFAIEKSKPLPKPSLLLKERGARKGGVRFQIPGK